LLFLNESSATDEVGTEIMKQYGNECENRSSQNNCEQGPLSTSPFGNRLVIV
jgi:hypothetical protein